MKVFRYLFHNLITSGLKLRTRPRTIQMPITNRCNSKCITCNVWKTKNKTEIDPAELERVLSDPYFAKVTSVGINGGEPSLHSDLSALVHAVCQLKSLKNIYVISNGLNTDRLLSSLKTSQAECRAKKISLHLTVSVDGVGQVHETVRGINGSFEKTMHTIQMIRQNQGLFCDTLNIGCTISNGNIFSLASAKAYFKPMGLPVSYHLAVPNKRIGTFYNQTYSVVDNRYNSMLAREFFYGLFKYSDSLKTQLTSFMNYYFLMYHKRLASCGYLREDITLDENLDLYLCAVASDKIASLKGQALPVRSYVKSHAFQREEKKVEPNCKGCYHYVTFPTIKGFFLFLKEKLKPLVFIEYMFLSKI